MNNAVLRARTAELRAADVVTWRTFERLPFELWADAALLDFLAGTGWASAIDAAEPTAAELRAIVALALGEEHASFTPTEPGTHDHDDD